MTAPLHHRRCWSPTKRTRPRRLLITAGPTHEPIDSVRFIGNRSSGRMGIALAEAAAQLGWEVTLLLGPVSAAAPTHDRIRIERFRTCDDLQQLLGSHADRADILIMAAAVADYRPKPNPAMSGGKFRRTGGPITLELESTPDLLAGASARRRADQLFIGFALEPRAALLASAESKLKRMKIDLVVANPLETMDSETVEALVLAADGSIEVTTAFSPKRTSHHGYLRTSRTTLNREIHPHNRPVCNSQPSPELPAGSRPRIRPTRACHGWDIIRPHTPKESHMNRMNVASLLAVGLSTLGLAALAGGRSADSAAPASQTVAVTHTLTLEGANQVLAAAIAKATQRGAGGAIAVVDEGGNLIAFQRLDGTFAAGAAVSLGKARTSALFKKPTKAFEDSINGGRTALAAVHEMTPLQGGVPIMHEGFIVGAIGVSGAHSQQEDEEIALAGAAAIASPESAAAK